MSNKIPPKSYFKTAGLYYMFHLAHADGEACHCATGITDACYDSDDNAKTWYASILRTLTEHNDHPDYETAVKKLERLYDVMTRK